MNENKEDQSPTKENVKQTDDPEGLEPVKSNSNPEKQMDIESESSKHENGKTSQKNGNGSAKKHPQQRHQQAKERPSLGIEEKKKLSREELKNLRAIELIEKMEQQSKRKEENSRKKQKKDQDNVQNQIGIEKHISNENGRSRSVRSSPLPSPRRETTAEETEVPVQRTESQKKVDNRSFSKFLNPKFDLQGHLNLVAYIHDYQANIFKQRAEEDSKHLLVEANGSNKDQDFSSYKNALIFEVQENAITDQKSTVEKVNGKFTEYLKQNQQAGKFRDPSEMIRGFKY